MSEFDRKRTLCKHPFTRPTWVLNAFISSGWNLVLVSVGFPTARCGLTVAWSNARLRAASSLLAPAPARGAEMRGGRAGAARRSRRAHRDRPCRTSYHRGAGREAANREWCQMGSGAPCARGSGGRGYFGRTSLLNPAAIAAPTTWTRAALRLTNLRSFPRAR